ncbi:dihydroxyacetone kinase phosphotransfer subunit [Arcanobacterium pluranimalium]|uniref:dihydroxyacetone kinase phosphoryl donor subunit DhaM n=1 Tax=Arcanobacterium pluranimalium TaxID=108028 RepID=UPI0019578F94|nr:dihydroxyacetone kinase phosphoryl donor subunit DhaM [Arcanobacterium pluranimalium]MBM7825246.1 dihydroxyacetone kinase phosphotransfer subunit [Arcanobacterium pluranimalium]
MSVGIVVVSHSRALAEAAVDLANIMVHADAPRIAIAAGLDDGGFGTDATQIMSAIEEVDGGDGVVIFVDMGSAVMSAQTAIELLDSDARILAAPFVEGITAGVVAAATGADLVQVVKLAQGSLNAKVQAVGEEVVSNPGAGCCGNGECSDAESSVTSTPVVSSVASVRGAESDACEADVEIVNEIGLHARPAGKLAQLVSEFDAVIEISCDGREPVEADSMMDLMSLGATFGQVLHVRAAGVQKEEALAAVVDFIQSGMGE